MARGTAPKRLARVHYADLLLARELGKHLHEVTGWAAPGDYVTHLHKLVWLEWLRMDLERPGKSEWYAMQIACEVRRVLCKTPSAIKVGDFRLGFVPGGGDDDPGSSPLSGDDDERLDREKQIAIKALRGAIYTPPPAEADTRAETDREDDQMDDRDDRSRPQSRPMWADEDNGEDDGK